MYVTWRSAIATLALSAIVATTACLDDSGPVSNGPVNTLDTLPGLLVSHPVDAPPVVGNAIALGDGASAAAHVVYVSMIPGTVPTGLQATIRDQATGAPVTTTIVGGGFDPVPIAAEVGDTLQVEITRLGAGPLQGSDLVKPIRPPTVVRTSPPKGGHDVPLNAVIVVVFSEPIDSLTLTTGSIQLWRDSAQVGGTVRFADAAHLRVEFHPDSLLAPQTAYRLVATQAIRDASGTPLDSALDVPFTTGTAIAPPAVSLVVSGLPTSVPAGASAFAVTAQDASGHTATGYTGTVHFTSTDAIALLPQDYTFVAGDAGSRTFAVTLKTAGDQTITATDLATSITGGEAVAVTVTAAGGQALYVVNDGHDGGIECCRFGSSELPPQSVSVYTGNAAPAGTLAGANTGSMERFTYPQGIAVDGAGRLYVADGGGRNRILVFAPGATGNATPVDSIVGSNTGLSYPSGLALDAAGRLYVANIVPPPADSYSVTVYAAGATGNATPIATILGSNTGLNVPIGIALDATGRLYVANVLSITVYAAGANGNATPSATIQGSATGLDRPIGLAVDGSGNIYVVANFLFCGYDSLGRPPPDTVAYNAKQSIVVFAAGATGNASPIATIQGSNTGLDGALGLAVDAAGRLWVANATSCPARMDNPEPSFGSITVYAPGATGNVAPVARIAGNSTRLFGPAWIAFREGILQGGSQ
jgi:sugar lactone lactonase YvrE